MGTIKKGKYVAHKNNAGFTSNNPPKKKKRYKPVKPMHKDYTQHDFDWDNYFASGSYWNCHDGNTKVLTLNRNKGGTLFIGGWSRGAHHTDQMSVIDLTAGARPASHRGTYYKIGVKDFGVPQWSLFFWESLAMLTYNELLNGDVLIACQGGHGRSGMIVATVAYILSSKRSVNIISERLLNTDPVAWIRSIHCQSAVETVGQEIAVLETALEFRENVHVRNALDTARAKPRYVYKSKKYDKFKQDWEDEKEPEDDDVPYVCPICLDEHNTVVEAVMCCNTRSLRTCPVCFKDHDYTVQAYDCCRISPLA